MSEQNNNSEGDTGDESETDNELNEEDVEDFDPADDEDDSNNLGKWAGDEPIEDYNGYSDWEYDWEPTPDVGFDDIGGYNSVKERLKKKVIEPHKDKKGLYDHFNVDPLYGILFHGPPGTGKTLFARALANELNRTFIEVGQADITHSHINKSPRLIKTLFMEAQLQRAVIFIDEADSLLSKRDAYNSHEEDSKITNTFLRWLTKEETSYITIFTTNLRDKMDEAALRNGRVDAKFEIGLPDLDSRKEILEVKLEDVPNSFTDNHINYFANHLEGLSGADIDSLINESKLVAIDREGEKLKMGDVKKAYNEMGF